MKSNIVYIDIDDTLVDVESIIERIYECVTGGSKPPVSFEGCHNDPRFMKIINDGEFMDVPLFNYSVVDLIARLIVDRIEFKFVTHRGYFIDAENRTKVVMDSLSRILRSNLGLYGTAPSSEELMLNTIFLNPKRESESDKLSFLDSISKGRCWVLVDDNPSYYQVPDEKWSDNLILFYAKRLYDTHPVFNRLALIGSKSPHVNDGIRYSTKLSTYVKHMVYGKLSEQKDKLLEKEMKYE